MDSEDHRKAQKQRLRDTCIINATAVALLCYAKNDRPNALQGIVGYFLFASNTAKRCVEVLNRLGLTVTYKTVNSALKYNAEASLKKMREVVRSRRFSVAGYGNSKERLVRNIHNSDIL